MCVCVCVHVCVPEYLCVYMFECVDLCVHVWGRGVQPRVCMLVGVSISLLDCVCWCMCVCVCVRRHVCGYWNLCVVYASIHVVCVCGGGGGGRWGSCVTQQQLQACTAFSILVSPPSCSPKPWTVSQPPNGLCPPQSCTRWCLRPRWAWCCSCAPPPTLRSSSDPIPTCSASWTSRPTSPWLTTCTVTAAPLSTTYVCFGGRGPGGGWWGGRVWWWWGGGGDGRGGFGVGWRKEVVHAARSFDQPGVRRQLVGWA